MWKEAALLAAGCTLFVNMGLSDAVQETLGFRSRILSCPKCCVFWSTLAYLILNGCRVVVAIGASFLFSYLALWADLGLSALNRIYNELYEQVFAPKARSRKNRSEKGGPGVSQVRKKP